MVTDSTIYHPRMISIPGSSYCELARWALDWWGIPFVEECHTPVFHVLASRRYGGGSVVPVVDTGETALLNAREVVDYYEARSPIEQKLYPSDAEDRTEAKRLFDFFFDTFGVAARAWAYAYILPVRDAMLRAWTDRVPFWERWCAHILYPFLASRVRRGLALKPNTITDQQAVIEAALAHVESRLADGRRFLMGERLTAPDLALAALAAPILLPAEFGGPMPSLDELPIPMRVAVQRWQARPAGKYILRLYKENRPQRAPDVIALGKHGSGRTFKDRLLNFLIGPGVLRPVFTLFRRVYPIFIFGKHAIVTRYDDVVEVLKRDRDFTISQVNAEKINTIDGPFILGMDASPEYDRENAVLHQAVHREDLPAIRQFVAQAAAELIEAARPRRRIDVVNGLARVVPVRLVAAYFGMPGPNDATMMRWMRDVFHFIFANLTNAPSVLEDALNSSAQLRRHMDAQIALRKSLLVKQNRKGVILDRLLAMQDESPSARGNGTVLQIKEHTPSLTEAIEDGNDDVLGRLLALQDSTRPWLDDNAVRRNLGGVIVGAVDTTSKFVTLAMDELLRRPTALAEARAAALGGDIEAVRRYAWEAVRFNPHHPLQARFCPQETWVAAGQSRSKSIPAGSSVYAATLSAMFDPAVFTHPNEFNANRNAEYLHFGYGMHACFGRYVNGVQIPELVAALLRLPNLRRAAGSAGQILYDGPFPDRLVLEFDA
jgi:cytochrome P450/glutathione S-transferase